MTPRPLAAGTLAARAEHAVKWSALTTLARFLVQLGAQVTLARLLGPGPYGLYGIGIAILTFATFLAGTGLSYSLMLRANITDADIRFAFTWQLAAGAGCAMAMALAAPTLAAFFGEAALASTVRWLALACLLTAASATSVCLLQRDLDFRALGLIQLAAYALGYLGCGLPLALAGWGADALALACVAQAGATLVGTWWRRPHPRRPLLRHDDGGHTLGTGRTVFVTNLVNWLLANLDRLVIGRLLHAHAVGLYTVAWNFAQIPVTLVVNAVQPAFLASGARIANEPRQLAQAWRLVLACVLVLVLPAATTLALLAPDIVRLLWGPAWAETGWVLQVMCLCLPAWVGWGLSTPVLWNTGRKAQEAGLQLPVLLLAAPLWWWAAPQGLRWVAGISALAVYARCAVTVAAGLRALEMPASLLLPLAGRGLLLSLGCGAVTRLAQAAVAPLLLPGPLQAAVSLAAGGAAALTAALALAWALPALLGDEARLALSRVLPFMTVAQGARP